MNKYFMLYVLCLGMMLAFALVGCSAENTVAAAGSPPVYRYYTDSGPRRILLLNACNLDSNHYRKKKKALFKKFIDSVLLVCKAEINLKEGMEAETMPDAATGFGLVSDSVYTLMEKKGATHAVVITGFDVDFEQTKVEVTKQNDGNKSRRAFYDINSTMHFVIYASHSILKDLKLKKNSYYGSRSVVSGFFAAGPSVIAQSEDAWQITHSNLKIFLATFFAALR
jgi:hypothetical protein